MTITFTAVIIHAVPKVNAELCREALSDPAPRVEPATSVPAPTPSEAGTSTASRAGYPPPTGQLTTLAQVRAPPTKQAPSANAITETVCPKRDSCQRHAKPAYPPTHKRGPITKTR